MHTNILDAIAECGPGHPAHVTNNHNERIVAIRTGFKAGTFNLDFSDPKVDLRSEKNGSEICNVPADRVQRTIAVFLGGPRLEIDRNRFFDQFINQASRECELIKVTPTRCRIEYELPNSGITGSWRSQTTIGRYTYVGSY